MNARDIQLLTFYATAIQSLCEAQKESYSANVPKHLATQIGDITLTMCTDLAGHVDPVIERFELESDARKAIRKVYNCSSTDDCRNCHSALCPCNKQLYVPKRETTT